ncbi:MAG: PH domain-containing protein [Caldilineaceae bacterium]|nr:PH domain-containing protein [Caldilineaceae bacterium]
MQRDEIRNIVNAEFQRSLAESGTQITALPPNQLQALAGALADSVFAAIAAVEDEETSLAPLPHNLVRPTGEPEMTQDVPEQKLWRGRPYLTIGTIYEITSQRIRVIKGVFGNHIDEVELIRVRDTSVKQHLGERMLDVGDITILSNDPSHPELVLNNVKNPLEVRELIRGAVNKEKDRRGLRYREDM